MYNYDFILAHDLSPGATPEQRQASANILNRTVAVEPGLIVDSYLWNTDREGREVFSGTGPADWAAIIRMGDLMLDKANCLREDGLNEV